MSDDVVPTDPSYVSTILCNFKDVNQSKGHLYTFDVRIATLTKCSGPVLSNG